MRRQNRVTTTVDKPEHIIFGNFLAEPDAAGTEDAALVVQRNAWSELHRLRLFNLVFQETGFCCAIFDAEFLETAFARLITNRAIQRVINEEKFHCSPLAFTD